MSELKIWETEDYNLFKNALEKYIDEWEAENNFPKSKRKVFPPKIGKSFYLWGEAGSGKTEYLNIWRRESNRSIREINNLNQVMEEKNIYLFDAVNESKNFDEKILNNILNNKNIFIIFSGWDRSNIFSGHNINPSEEIIISKGWKEISDHYWTDNFSIREKNLMCNIKNINRIKNKEFHSLVWKAFENIITKKEKEYYKKIIKINPLYVDDYRWKRTGNLPSKTDTKNAF